MTPTEEFFEKLLCLSPALREIHREHVAADDVVIPHGLLGEIVRWMIGAAERAEHRPVLQQILVIIDEALASDDEYLSNLAAVSGIENLCGEVAALEVLVPMMSDASRELLNGFSDWYGIPRV